MLVKYFAPKVTVKLYKAYQQWTETDSLYGARHLADRWQRTLSPHRSDKNELQTIVSGLGRNLI
jgi:hypothetical protein